MASYAKIPEKEAYINPISKCDITLSDYKKGKSKTHIQIPWLPSEIKFNSGGVVTTTYTLLGLGDVNIPVGSGVSEISWESMFPGSRRKNHPFCRIPPHVYKKPGYYQSKLSMWKRNGTKLKLMISATPINMDVYIDNYEITYANGFGDYLYSIVLKQYKDVNVDVKKPSKAAKSKTTSATKRPSPSPKTYKVKSGDNLWKIATNLLKKGTRWREIYNLNKDLIEKTAKKHGKKSSDQGHWIYSGTVLKIPTK